MAPRIFKASTPTPQYPTGMSLPAYYRSHLHDEFLDKTSQVCTDSGVEYTFRQVIDLDLRFATALKQGGFELKHGNQIALFLPTVPEYLSIVLGVLDAGMVTVHFNPDYTEFELTPLFEQLSISAAICTPSNYERLKNILDKFGIKAVISVGANDHGVPNYFDLVKRYEPMMNFDPCDENETAFILFSSGSTGVPKGAAMTHRNFITQLIGSRAFESDFNYAKENESIFSTFSAFHSGGLMLLLWAFEYKRKAITAQGRLGLEKFGDVLKNFKPSIVWANSTVLSMICALEHLNKEDFTQLKCILFGGGCIEEGLLKRLRVKVGPDVKFYSAYGASELSALVCGAPLDETKIGQNLHSGRLMPGIELKVVDPETGKTIGENELGEFCFRGPMVFKGYVNNEEANEQSLKDGWFHSGDLGYIDEKGLVYIVGRIKELIKVHGYQVAPEEIENMIKKHELVKDAIVFGVPDPRTQEAPRACVVPKSNTLTENDIQEFLNDKLIYYKQLRGGIRFVESLPTLPGMNKLSRKAAKEMDAAMAKKEAK